MGRSRKETFDVDGPRFTAHLDRLLSRVLLNLGNLWWLAPRTPKLFEKQATMANEDEHAFVVHELRDPRRTRVTSEYFGLSRIDRCLRGIANEGNKGLHF